MCEEHVYMLHNPRRQSIRSEIQGHRWPQSERDGHNQGTDKPGLEESSAIIRGNDTGDDNYS